jgi:hypothetical protein
MRPRAAARRRLSVALFAALLAGCNPVPSASPSAATGRAPSSDPAVSLNLAPHVRIAPSAVLLATVGETRKLTAQAFDAAGNKTGGSAAWSSSDPATVAVAGDGTVTAAAFGSAQITATIDGVTSPPVLAVVARPAAGVTLVTDEQITDAPVATDPGADPSSSNTYRVTLTGITAKAGDLLLGTGEKALAGKVVAVDGSRVTMALVPLPDLLPELHLDQSLDLTNAEVQAPPDIVRLYDITRSGDTYEFTPKPDFMQLVAKLPAPAGSRRLTASLGSVAAATGTYMLPFEECETELASLPFTISEPPSFSMSVNPSLDVAWTPDTHLQHWLVRAQPKATLKVLLKITAEFEASIACKATFFEYVIPIGGALSFFLSGKIPVGLGFEASGKVVIASATIGGKVEASANAALGIDCASGVTCSFVNTLDGFKVDPKLTFVAPSIGELRLQPGFEVNGFVEAAIGNPFLQSLTLDLAEATVGGKASADWAPRQSQMTDPAYRSEYSLSLEAAVSAGTKLADIAEELGIAGIEGPEFETSTELYHSPTAKLTTDKSTYAAGETVLATVHFEPAANLKILEVAYNVDRVLLVQYTGGTATTVGTETVLGTATATDGQSDFSFVVPVSTAVSASDIYAFVVPKYFSPSDALALELEHVAEARIAYVGLADHAIHSTSPNGTGDAALSSGGFDRQPMWSPDRTSIAFIRDTSKVIVANADGSNPRTVASAKSISSVRWSPDGTMLAFGAIDDRDTNLKVVNADGSGQRNLGLMMQNGSTIDQPTWSPDSKSIAYIRVVNGGAGTTPASLHVASLTGSDRTLLSAALSGGPTWSPVGSSIVLAMQAPDGTIQVFTVDATSGQAVQITHEVASHSFPVWSPDGTKIAFTSSIGGVVKLIVAKADGTAPVTIAADPNWSPTWSPDGALVLSGFRSGDVRAYPAGGGSPVFTIASATLPSWKP